MQQKGIFFFFILSASRAASPATTVQRPRVRPDRTGIEEPRHGVVVVLKCTGHGDNNSRRCDLNSRELPPAFRTHHDLLPVLREPFVTATAVPLVTLDTAQNWFTHACSVLVDCRVICFPSTDPSGRRRSRERTTSTQKPIAGVIRVIITWPWFFYAIARILYSPP